jgi:hypothetical protein
MDCGKIDSLPFRRQRAEPNDVFGFSNEAYKAQFVSPLREFD